jgi:hypothetical protein
MNSLLAAETTILISELPPCNADAHAASLLTSQIFGSGCESLRERRGMQLADA